MIRPLQNTSPLNQLMSLLFLWLFGTLISLAIIKGLGLLIWNSNLFDLAASPDLENALHINQLRFIQIINQLFSLLLPPILLAILISPKPLNWLAIDKAPRFSGILLMVLLTVAIYPLVELLAGWNMALKIPEALSGLEEMMRNSEENAARLTEAFLMKPDAGSLAMNLLMVGILAALGEELFFRAALINILQSWFRNRHLAVIISALLFATLHLQFFTFLPRFMLGIILGYVFIWSGTVWIPFITHMVYNSTAAIIYFLIARGSIALDPENISGNAGPLIYTTSFILSALLLWLFRRSVVDGR
jgi:uncharacterized protein